MAIQTPPGRTEINKLIAVKGPPSLHRRLKIAAAEEGLSYADLLTMWLDARDKRLENQRRQMNHPLRKIAP